MQKWILVPPETNPLADHETTHAIIQTTCHRTIACKIANSCLYPIFVWVRSHIFTYANNTPSFCNLGRGMSSHECNAFGFDPPLKISLLSSNFNDGFCDCADGSDEGGTNACDIVFSKRVCCWAFWWIRVRDKTSMHVSLKITIIESNGIILCTCCIYQRNRFCARLMGRKTKVISIKRRTY